MLRLRTLCYSFIILIRCQSEVSLTGERKKERGRKRKERKGEAFWFGDDSAGHG